MTHQKLQTSVVLSAAMWVHLAGVGSCAFGADAGSSRRWRVPGDVPEMMAACQDIPALYNFSRNGYLSIECGYQAILLGSRIPIGPAPHVPWAKPYAKGKLKVLAICCFGNAPCDTTQVVQVARELDCDMRFVLIAHVTVGHAFGKDDGYRLGYLAKQAREALKRNYDVIILAMGSYSPGYGYPLTSAIFPDDVYETILQKVRKGTGLVTVGSNMGGWWLAKTPLLKASPATMTQAIRTREVRVRAAKGSDLFAGMPLERLPKVALYRWKPRPGTRVAATEGDKNEPLVVTGTHGKGRTVLLGWDGTLTPVKSNADRYLFEHGMAITLRAIVHAAGADPPVQVHPQTATMKAGAPGQAIVALSGPANLHCTLRDGRFESMHQAVVKASAGSAAVALPSVPAGTYWLDVIAKNAKGAVVGWGTGRVDVTGRWKLAVKTDKDTYKAGETVRVSATVEGNLPKATAEVTVHDATGRLLARGLAKQAGGAYRFDYRVADARVAPHVATVCVTAGGQLVLKERVPFYVPSFVWDDYHNILWPGGYFKNFAYLARHEAGITSVMDGWGTHSMGEAGAPVGITPSRMNDGVLSPEMMQKDPAKGETANERTLEQAIEAARKYGVVAWAMQDERHCTKDPGMPTDEGLRRYRQYLTREYATLTKLNASWGTTHKAWDAIKPTLTKDLSAKTTNLAPWLDFRLYVADQCYRADKRHADMIRKGVGPIPVGIDGFTSSGHVIPYGGVDIGKLLADKVFTFYCPYGDDLMIASMVPGPMVKYIGWGQGRKVYFGNPWRDVFRGHWGTFRFFGPTFFSQFGWTQPAGRWIAEGTRELRHGVGKLLMGARRQIDPVAILYSYSSMLATAAAGVWVEGEKGNTHLMWRPANWSRNAFETMLLRGGNSFGYLTEAQVGQGALKGRKLLIIPHFMGIALRDSTCAAIKRFVAQGGIVVADLAPAVLDGHGKPRAKGGLDDLFGVTRNAFAYATRTSDYLVGVTENDPLVPRNAWYVGEWYEKGLKVTDGKALGKHWFQDVPAMVAKKTGKGRALLLNFLHTCMVRRNGEPEADDIKLMETILRVAGVKPQAVVQTDYGKRQRHCEINTLRDGAATYVGAYAHKMPTDKPSRMVIRFGTRRHTYDVRRARYAGRVDRAPLPLFQQGAALFARLDYRVTGVSVSAGSVQRGQPVPVTVSLSTSAPAGRHVVHLEVTDPAGKRNLLYTRNVAVTAGRCAARIHTALSDAPGTWAVVAREVVSGKTAKTTFNLR